MPRRQEHNCWIVSTEFSIILSKIFLAFDSTKYALHLLDLRSLTQRENAVQAVPGDDPPREVRTSNPSPLIHAPTRRKVSLEVNCSLAAKRVTTGVPSK
ncbi:hypothetical protein JTB14_012217 [Gonioctena quinquepunctata]|nr:hypothetical protein JTB14_012217 [Gonioctena quinquepunctata]